MWEEILGVIEQVQEPRIVQDAGTGKGIVPYMLIYYWS